MRSEFDFIQHLKKKYRLELVGDDCAVLPKDSESDQLITVDLLVEDIDFRAGWTTPGLLGAKALAVSLSDIAAMGGEPRWAMTSIGVPVDIWKSDFVEGFYGGWFNLARQVGVELIGGDVSRTPERIVIDSIVAGEVPKGTAVLRSGARPGDSIYVSGKLGGAVGGLSLLEAGVTLIKSSDRQRELIVRNLRPTPRIVAGRYLSKNKLASSMIDISDGLSSDLDHLCKASGVGATIDASRLPIDENLNELALTHEQRVELAIHGGEDFELLFTVPREKIPLLKEGQFVRIGHVTANVGVVELTSGAGATVLKPRGYRHF